MQFGRAGETKPTAFALVLLPLLGALLKTQHPLPKRAHMPSISAASQAPTPRAASRGSSLALPSAQLRRLEPFPQRPGETTQPPSAPMLMLRTPTATRVINDTCYPQPIPPPSDAAFVLDQNQNGMPGSASFLWQSNDGYVYISSTMCIGRVVEGD